MAKGMSRLKKTVIIASVAALSLGGAGIAFAYWTSTGTGSGTATTGESVAFEITTETAVGEISPGSPGQTVAFTVTNPGPGVQFLGAVTVRLADEEGTPWVPTGGCLAADYVATISTPPAYGEMAAEAEVSGVATVTLTNTTVNQDACQNQIVPLYFEADPTVT